MTSATKHLLLIHHSQTGSTAALAQAVLDGARDDAISGVELRVASPLSADAEDVRWADAVILGTQDNFGYMSGALKYFFDRIYYPCLDHTQGLPYALVIKAGNDGAGALASVRRIVTGLRWREVQAPVIVKGDVNAEGLAACRELGMALAAGLEAGLF